MSDSRLFRRSRRCFSGLVLLASMLLMVLPGAAQDDVVSTVDGEPVLRATFHARTMLVRWQYVQELEKLYELTGGNLGVTGDYVLSLAAALDDPAGLGDSVLAQMEEERLLWKTGQELGIVPTAEDTQERENEFFSLWTDVPTAEVSASEPAQAFIGQWYAEASAVSGLSQDDLRWLFATDVLRDQLFDHLSANVPKEEIAVHTRHILCGFFADTQAEITAPGADQRAAAEACIQDAQTRLQAGEEFGAVAAALSADRASAAQGGDVGWQFLSYLTANYADAARTAALNTVTGPVETEFGLHLIDVLEREMRTLDDQQYAEAQAGYFSLWLSALRSQATIVRAPDWDQNLPVSPGLESLDTNILDAVTNLMDQTSAAP